MSFLHRQSFFVALLLALVIYIVPLASAAESKCAGESQFSCPNCGGISVSDCMDCDGYLFTDYNYGLCYNRKLFNTNAENGNSDNHYPFLWTDIVGTIVWFLTAGIATACGVGGGGIYVPMGILLLRFPPKPSSGLSQASIFGASLGGILVNIRKRHPDEHIRDTKGTPSEEHPGKMIAYEKGKGPMEIEDDREKYLDGGDGKRKFYTRPVIDYNMALFLAPMEMAGAVLGVIIQRVFPNWLFLCFAAVVLGFTAFKTFKKFFVAYAKDKAAKEERIELTKRESRRVLESQKKKESDANGEGAASDAVDDVEGNANTKEEKEEEDDPKQLEQRRKFLEEDSRQYPFEKISYLILLWIGLTIITFLKGGKGVDSVIGITCQDAGFYVLVAAQFLWTLGFAAVFGYKNVKGVNERVAVNYPFNETDVMWDFKKLQFYSFFTFVAGIVAGLIGIGGGMVLGPLMIVMGVNPRVSTATTATMILLTSSSVAVMFVMSGLVPWQYAVYFFFVCLLGAYIGKTRIDAYVKKTGMGSILVGILATIIALATIGCIIILFLNLAKVDWCVDGFKAFCTVSSEENACPTRLLSLSAEEIFPY
ncbi:sulfite exporter TauE/SafE family protein [Skeletonema marinoi]|uniref:Sulfite exporter TauE/SafE family protein n=1 Tax=Skeletonema marinoi TaxID=267567 RepID=A0AAD8Y6D3_9STRA|nr:sulfite exporter TauE/SafE family protein [Skeletonema marinoi]|mmetsp:Transcript_23148/g.39559  ORF Transcript_23148/g.39559 Transcript_23148/m.39559 type:complete len:593 (-) Transcript_23148:97-1875(-)